MLTDAEEVSEQVGVYVRVDSFDGADGTLSVQELVTTTWTYTNCCSVCLREDGSSNLAFWVNSGLP